MSHRLCRPLVLNLLFSLAWLVAFSAQAEPLQSWRAAIGCEWGSFQLHCRFRPLDPIVIQQVELSVDEGKPWQIDGWQPFAKSDANSAVLWLIDISNPARADTVARQALMLHNWLGGMASYHRLGLAAFADGLHTLAPLGSDTVAIGQALDGVSARGQSTAFYRALLESVELLKRVEAQRKSLWVFSDGLAEDTAYRHEDVVAAAKAAGVIIVGLGYPERESQQPDLQRLQRLAEETGGHFVAAPARGNLPAGALADILTVVDGGGSFSADLPALYGAHRLTIKLLTDASSGFAQTLDMAGPAPPVLPPQPEAMIAPQAETTGLINHPASIAAGLGIVVAILLGWKWRKPTAKPLLANLEVVGSKVCERLAVRTPVVHIGRAHDNDLCLDNDSVSAHHAELRRCRDGLFTIVDLGATNGVWVNGEKTNCQALRDGDLIELGEVQLRFWRAPYRARTL